MASGSSRYSPGLHVENEWTGLLSVVFRDLRHTEPASLKDAVASLEESAGVEDATIAAEFLMEQAKSIVIGDSRMVKLAPYVLLYSAEDETRPPVYKAMNERCYIKDRNKVKEFAGFMYGLMHALAALPPLPDQQVVWRGVPGLDLRPQYPVGATIVWWGCGSCTASLEVLERQPQFLGVSGLRTIFTIQLLPNTRARAIEHLSLVPSEREILLPFGTTFEVITSAAPSSDGLSLVHLKEKEVEDKGLVSIWEEALAAASAGGAPAAPPAGAAPRAPGLDRPLLVDGPQQEHRQGTPGRRCTRLASLALALLAVLGAAAALAAWACRRTPAGGPWQTIAASFGHICAVTQATREVRCWGLNGDGQTDVPETLGAVVGVSAGEFHTCAVTQASRELRCWGRNSPQTYVPEALGPVVALAAGYEHTCAATQATRELRCWGLNDHGQTSVPATMGPVVALAAGESHTCAVTQATRELRCWGLNELGQTSVPATMGPVVALAAGACHTCAVTQASRQLRCWGRNASGQSGVPEDLGPVVALSAGARHTCAVTQASRELRCWGDNQLGQTSVPEDLGPVVALAAGEFHTCAATQASRELRCWGNNASRQSSVPDDLGPVFVDAPYLRGTQP